MLKFAVGSSLSVVSAFALFTACGGKVDPVGQGGAGGSGGSAGDAGFAGTGGVVGCNGKVDPTKKYVSRDPEQCKLMDFACPPDSTPFSDDCGCGCQKVPACNITECFRAVECVTACGGPIVQSGCCPCKSPAFDSIVCQSLDAGSCGCTSTPITWGMDGGLVAYSESSTLTPCRTYRHERLYRSDPPSLTCTEELPCEPSMVGPEDIAKLLASPDVQAALKAAPVTYGVDSRPVDGQVFRMNIGGKIIEVGSDCPMMSSSCKAIPVGVAALRTALLAIDKLGLGQGSCYELFTR